MNPFKAAKIMCGYFKSFNAFEKVFLKMKRVKNLDYLNINFDELVESFKSHKFKKTHSKNPNLSFDLTPEIKKLHNEEMYEYYCDCREERTGYRDTFGNPSVTKSIVNTNIKKYGVRSTAQLEWVKEKQTLTNMKKYGVKSPLCKEDIRKLRLTKISSPKKDRISKFEPSRELLETFIELGRFNVKKCAKFFLISRAEAEKLKEKFGIDCPNVNPKEITQNIIFDSIKIKNKIKNTRVILGGAELDIFLPEFKIAIEYDGLIFHSDGNDFHINFKIKNVEPNYHLNKTLECESKGIQLFHIFEGENLDLWLSMIHSKIGINTRVYARKCSVREVESKETKAFLNENHIQGYVPARICLGLYENITGSERLVCVMTFSKPRFSKKYEYEMISFCSLKHHNVVGGASKLWKFFLGKYNPKSVVSYANLRFSNGELYEKLGFTRIGQSAPNCFYFKVNVQNLIPHHSLAKLKNSLNFDAHKSEEQNMFDNGYRRIFDCGDLIYAWFGS